MEAPHSLAPEEVAAGLETDARSGLSEDEARARLLEAGPNRIEVGTRPAEPSSASPRWEPSSPGAQTALRRPRPWPSRRSAFAELLLVNSLRSPVEPARRGPRNPYLLGSVVLSAAFVALAVYLPALHEPLGTVALGASELGLVALFAVLPFVVVEAGKPLLRRTRRLTLGA